MDQSETIRLDLPATYKYLNVAGACVAELLVRVEGLAEPKIVAYNLQLALQEACTNIVKHAYGGEAGGRIGLTFSLLEAPRRVVIELHDSGRPFEIDQVPEPDLDEIHEGGYGIFLIRSLLDELTYTPGPGGNRWRLVKQI